MLKPPPEENRMPKPHDNDPVMVSYSAMSNISFRGEDELGYTWGEWRQMDKPAQDEAVSEFLFQLVDVYVKED